MVIRSHWNGEVPQRPLRAEVADADLLTPREVQVLHRLANGHLAPRIARDLVLATPTVKTHLAHIYRKLGVRDRAAAVARGFVAGIITADDLDGR